mgnify:CR=1 FL=1
MKKTMKIKTALVTGGAGNLGAAFCQIFAREGYRVGLIDVDTLRSQEVLECLLNPELGHFEVSSLDISTMIGVKEVFRAIPSDSIIKVLVNNAAGNSSSYSKEDRIEERWDKTMNNDLKHVFLMSERAVVEMREHGGSIVNISSIAGNLLGSKSLPYAAAKSAITGLTKSLARIYGAHGIRVNAIIPGVIGNERTEAADVTGYFSSIKNQTPLKRWGKADEIAEAVLFIASEKCEFLHGASIVIDGGATLTLGPRIDEPIPFKWEAFSEV